MPKADRNLTELKRQVRLLLALDGRALRLADGLWLVREGRVRDVHALRALLQRPGVARNALKACFTEGTHCEPLSRQHLAAATHALAVLQTHVDELEATPARWLGGQRRDRAWLAAQRQRVQRLSAWMLAPPDGAALAAWHGMDALPPLDARSEALAWLCDAPPTGAVDLGGRDIRGGGGQRAGNQWPGGDRCNRRYHTYQNVLKGCKPACRMTLRRHN